MHVLKDQLEHRHGKLPPAEIHVRVRSNLQTIVKVVAQPEHTAIH